MRILISSVAVSAIWHWWVGDPMDEFPARLVFVLVFSYPIDWALRKFCEGGR